MASMMEDSRVLGFLFGTDEMRAVWSEKNWVQKWLDTEAALARAQGKLGVIPRETADVIVSHARAEEIDMDALAEGFRSSITIVPLLNAFKKSLPGDAGEYVHWGATSQDIYDTGLVLMEREACSIILRDAKACLSAILALVKKYRDTPEAGRTHVVHAIPITFGFKAAGKGPRDAGKNGRNPVPSRAAHRMAYGERQSGRTCERPCSPCRHHGPHLL